MTVGFAFVFAGLVGWTARSVLESQVSPGLVSDASLRRAVKEVVVIATGLLGEIIGPFILVGLLVAAAAWFAGPARAFVAARRAIAPFLREQPVGTFAITTAVMVLVFIWDPIPATGTPVGIIVLLALALLGTEMLRRQTAIEFPDARPGRCDSRCARPMARIPRAAPARQDTSHNRESRVADRPARAAREAARGRRDHAR